MRNHKRAAYLGSYAFFCWRIFKERSHWLSSLRFDGGLINGLSTASVDSLHGNLKVARGPLGEKHDKAAFQNNEN